MTHDSRDEPCRVDGCGRRVWRESQHGRCPIHMWCVICGRNEVREREVCDFCSRTAPVGAG